MKERSALKEVADVNDPDSPSQTQIIIVQGSELMFSHQVTGKRKKTKKVCVCVCIFTYLIETLAFTHYFYTLKITVFSHRSLQGLKYKDHLRIHKCSL